MRTPPSTASPRSWRTSRSRRAGGRGRLPTWVVRIRSSLRFMASTGTGSYTLPRSRPWYTLWAPGRCAWARAQVVRAAGRRGVGAPPTEARLQSEEACMFFELRQYHIRPGQRDKWVRCMEEEIIPFQVKMGMVILGSFVGEEDESVYVWIRRFENEQERKRLYDLVYQSDYWKNEISPKVPTMIDREQIKVTRLVATPHSVIQ